jgi:outer membrane lipoprotein carrier protein
MNSKMLNDLRIVSWVYYYMLFTICSLILFPATSISSSEANLPESLGKPLHAKEMAEAVNRIKDIQKDIDVISATIYQRRKSPQLKKDDEKKGTITMKKPNLLYWEITKPERQIRIIDGRYLWVYQQDLKEARRYTLSEQFALMQTMNFLSYAMNMSIKEMEKNFGIAAYNLDSNLIFELKPKSSIVAIYLSAIHIWYKEGEGVPHKFEVIAKNGDVAITEFADVALNPSIKENLFHFDAPPDVNVVTIGNEG